LTSPSAEKRVAPLRGAEAARIGKRFWLVASALGLLVVAGVIAVSFVSTLNEHARIDRMKAHGIPVTVTITACEGNLGGSGSNVASYTCRGSYIIDGTSYNELIASMTTFAATDTHVRAVADPSQHSSVALASAIKTSHTSPSAFIVLALLTLLLLALVALLIRAARRPSSDALRLESDTPPSSP
jgi:hypothetical protein